MKNEKRLLRSVMRVLHPDLYTLYPIEREANSDALKRLNGYLDSLANGVRITPISLEFWIKKDDDLERVEAELTENGNLSPLYFALGLITDEEYRIWTENGKTLILDFLIRLLEGKIGDGIDEDLVAWLRKFVSQVVQDGEQHTLLKNTVSLLKAELEEKFNLQNIILSSEFGIGVADLELQLTLLRTVEFAFEELEEQDLFTGLSFCIRHPDCLPLDPLESMNSAFGELQPSAARSSFCWVADDGSIHLFIKCQELSRALLQVDIDRSRLLTQLHQFWERRASDLRILMQRLFQVEDVLCDNSTSENVQKFVLWADCIMANRDQFRNRLARRNLPLTLLIHSDKTAPMIDYSTASSTLHIRTDCTPLYLLNFVNSEQCLNAGIEAKEMISDDAEEQRILEEARKALGAKHVIRICSVYDRQKAIKAAERLIKNAEIIRQTVDLSEAGIAIDSNYQAWDSGFISIPYDYHLKELKPNLQKLIGSGSRSPKGQKTTKKKTQRKSQFKTVGCVRNQAPNRNSLVLRTPPNLSHFSRRTPNISRIASHRFSLFSSSRCVRFM